MQGLNELGLLTFIGDQMVYIVKVRNGATCISVFCFIRYKSLLTINIHECLILFPHILALLTF